MVTTTTAAVINNNPGVALTMHMPDTTTNAWILHSLFDHHLSSSDQYYYHFHLTGEKTETKLGNLPKLYA